MDFTNQYLTYSEYIRLGGTLHEMPFNKLEFKARKRIDSLTLNRLTELDEQIHEVKMCMYELIETMKINENKSINNITSESIDGYSVNYGETSTQEENKMYNDIVRTYLKYCKTPDGVHYLYCGV